MLKGLAHFHDARLRRPNFVLWNTGLKLIFAVGLIPAFYPFVRYVDVRPFEIWLPLALIIGVMATHVALTLRTLVVATQTGVRPGHWDVFAVTGISAKCWVFASWRAAFRNTLGYHILFALLRLGVALSMAQLLHSSASHHCYYYGLGVFCYHNYGIYFYAGLIPPLFPLPFKIIVAGIVLVIFSLFEAGLLSAVVVAISSRFSRNLSVSISLIARAWLVGAAVMLWILIGQGRDTIFRIVPSYPPVPYSISEDRVWAEIRSNLDHLRPLFENAQAVVSTLADNGTLLAADLMRPTWGVVTMIRNIPSIVLGLMLYMGVIYGLLWLARRQLIKRGLLP